MFEAYNFYFKWELLISLEFWLLGEFFEFKIIFIEKIIIH